MPSLIDWPYAILARSLLLGTISALFWYLHVLFGNAISITLVQRPSVTVCLGLAVVITSMLDFSRTISSRLVLITAIGGCRIVMLRPKVLGLFSFDPFEVGTCSDMSK